MPGEEWELPWRVRRSVLTKMLRLVVTIICRSFAYKSGSPVLGGKIALAASLLFVPYPLQSHFSRLPRLACISSLCAVKPLRLSRIQTHGYSRKRQSG